MKCNICGGDLPEGEVTCKYCGNIMTEPKKEIIPKRDNEQIPVRRHVSIDVPLDATVHQQRRHQGVYCRKCGRPLDGVTHKCIVCDATQVGQRAYTNEEFKNREMNIMAEKKKKKKKNNSIRNVIFAIAGMILIFMLGLSLATNRINGWLGIGEKQEETITPENEGTPVPKVTTDPNWKPKDNSAGETPAPTQTVLPTKAPVRTPVPAESGDPVELRGGEYLYQSHEKVITDKELDKFDEEKIKKIYYEIYARHAYTFDDETQSDLVDYFENVQWYQPDTSVKEEDVETKFNSYEKENIEIIDEYREKKGWSWE